MNLINLTPHALNVFMADGQMIEILASGQVARCAEISTTAGVLEIPSGGGIPLAYTSYGDVSGLPDPEPGTVYIVSALVRIALPDRIDLASPGALVRDNAGTIIGARGLIVNRPA